MKYRHCKIGSVSEKAEAAKTAGAKVFLVPKGQGFENSYTREIRCDNIGGIRLCRTEYKPKRKLATDEHGLIVKEVSDVREALKYFLQQ